MPRREKRIGTGLHIGAVTHAYHYLDELIGVVAGEVLEVLVEESGVGERHHGSLHGLDLGALIGDAFHLAAHSFALDEISHPEAAGHQLDAVDEVVEYVLHGETDTGREAGGDDGDRTHRNLQ